MRDELAHQFARRRTRIVFGILAAIPIVLALVYVVRGTPRLLPGETPQLLHLAGDSALAFTIYVLYLCAPLLLLACAASFAGDAIAGEAAWGTLRYRLAAPGGRSRFFLRKLGASIFLAAACTFVLVGTSLLVGWICFGWHALDTPVGGTIDAGGASLRVAITIAYVLVTLMPFVAIALALSACIDVPLAAVATAMGMALLSQLLDVIPMLGELRVLLPTHYAYAWLDLFVDPPDPARIASGTLQATIVSALAIIAGRWWFVRRDITS